MAYDTSIVSPEKSGHSDILLTYFCLQSVPIVTTDHEMVIYRRPLVSVLSNRGVTSRDSIIAFTIPELEVGTVLVDIVPESDINDSANHVLVGIGGSIRVRVSKGKPRVSLYPSRPTSRVTDVESELKSQVFMPYQIAKTFQTIYTANVKHVLKNEELLPALAPDSSTHERPMPNTPRRSFRNSFTNLWRSPSKKPKTQPDVLAQCWGALLGIAYTPLINIIGKGQLSRWQHTISTDCFINM